MTWEVVVPETLFVFNLEHGWCVEHEPSNIQEKWPYNRKLRRVQLMWLVQVSIINLYKLDYLILLKSWKFLKLLTKDQNSQFNRSILCRVIKTEHIILELSVTFHLIRVQHFLILGELLVVTHGSHAWVLWFIVFVSIIELWFFILIKSLTILSYICICLFSIGGFEQFVNSCFVEDTLSRAQENSSNKAGRTTQ